MLQDEEVEGALKLQYHVSMKTTFALSGHQISLT